MLAIGLKSFSIQNVFLHRKKDLLVIIIIQVGVSIEKNITICYNIIILTYHDLSTKFCRHIMLLLCFST